MFHALGVPVPSIASRLLGDPVPSWPPRIVRSCQRKSELIACMLMRRSARLWALALRRHLLGGQHALSSEQLAPRTAAEAAGALDAV